MDPDSLRDNNGNGNTVVDETTVSVRDVSCGTESDSIVTVLIPHASKCEISLDGADLATSSFSDLSMVKVESDCSGLDTHKSDTIGASCPDVVKANSIPSDNSVSSGTNIERIVSLPNSEISSGFEEHDIVTVLIPDVGTSNSPSGKGKKRMSYDLETKLEAINHAELHSKRAAARKYGVDTKRIREWCCYKAEIAGKVETKCGKARKRLGGGGRKVFIPVELEDALVEWFEETKARGEKVKRKAISQKAEAMWHEMKGTMMRDPGTAQVDTFKASEGWVTSFMKRRGLTI